MEQRNHPGQVEDYTNAFLGVCGVILFMGLWTIGALFGFLWVLIWAAVIDTGLKVWSRQR